MQKAVLSVFFNALVKEIVWGLCCVKLSVVNKLI